MLFGAIDTLLSLFRSLGFLDALHAFFDQRAKMLGLGSHKGGETVSKYGGGGEHDGDEPIGDGGVDVAETEDDGKLSADDKGVTDGVGAEDSFKHLWAGGEDDGHKEEGENAEEHKELRASHGCCSMH